MVKAVFNYKGKKIEIDLKKCEGFEKMWGLMFTRRENASNLLFEFNKSVAVPIHSLFCPKFVRPIRRRTPDPTTWGVWGVGAPQEKFALFGQNWHTIIG